MKYPVLSIITICYNEKQIEKTCKSIVNQTWQDFEWIVVDGGSTDGTLDILKKYQDRIDVLISEPDKGIYNAMNKGMKLAQGKYLNFMNGGDAFYNNTVLEEVFKNKSYQSDILYGKAVPCFKSVTFPTREYPSPINMKYFRYNTIQHQSSFIKKELFNEYGLYNENNKIVSDYEKWLIFVQNQCIFEYLPQIIAMFDLSGMSTINWKQCIQEHEKAYHSVVKPVKQYDISFLKYFHFSKKIQQ